MFASDIYSLGVTCIHLLTNVRPFDLFDISEDKWVWRDYLVNNPVDKLLGEVLDGSIVNALTRRYRSATEMLAALSPKAKSAPTSGQPSFVPTPTFPAAINLETFEFQIAQLKKVRRQVTEVQTVKKLSRSGFKKVEQTYTKIIEEWQLQRKSGHAKRFIEALGNSVTLEMVAIPSGEFMMGAPTTENDSHGSGRPQHSVKVSSFYMGRYPVTQAQFEAVMGKNPSRFKGADLPVENVSWKGVQEFCRRLTEKTKRKYSLPSEAQWEYACRARTTTPFHFGETISTDIANYDGKHVYGDGIKGNSLNKTTSVGFFNAANNFGLSDMHGNVWEWCEDNWHSNYNNAPTDGTAWIERNLNNHVMRGGSWGSYPYYCCSAYRFRYIMDSLNDNIGFRVVHDPARTL
jgi:formylglycine-generating enzyme required for sulfatase activity